jgi:hypothetical protein
MPNSGKLHRRAQAHTHALLGMFNRSSMAAMIADSAASFRLSRQAERRIRSRCFRQVRPGRAVQNDPLCALELAAPGCDPIRVRDQLVDLGLAVAGFAVAYALTAPWMPNRWPG